MQAEEILKRIGYDNNSITTTEKWIAREVYNLAIEDAEALRQPLVSGSLQQCTKCGVVPAKGGGCTNHSDCPMRVTF